MFSDLNERLQRAADRRDQLAQRSRRLKTLEAEAREAAERAAELKAQLRKEERDVTRLEGASLTNFLYSALGTRDQRLQKERQEAAAAQLKYEEAVARHQALTASLAEVRQEMESLAGAEAEYQRLLAEKEEAISRAPGDAARRLFALTEQEQALRRQAKEIEEAIRAGRRADDSLTQVERSLDSAKGWGTWDMLGGGMIATAVKHSKMDEAEAGAQRAQRDLAAFRRELQDVSTSLGVTTVTVEGFMRFADYFFDGLIVDWAVQSKINRSLDSVKDARSQVGMLLSDLSRRQSGVQRDLEQVAAERAAFIAKQ